MKPQANVARRNWQMGLALLLALLLEGCAAVQAHPTAASPIPTLTPTLTPTPSVVIHLEGDGPTFNDPHYWCGPLFKVIADATISTLGPSEWVSRTSAPPPSLDQQTLVNGGYWIVTPMQFSTKGLLLDNRSQATKEFVYPGGQIGTVKMVRDDVPRIGAGQRYILLFEMALDPQAQAYTETRLQLVAAFPVDSYDMVVLQVRVQGKGENVPEQRVPLPQVLREMAACKAP